MFVKLPTWLSTLLNRSGRSHAAVKAQMPPELMPPIARPAASGRRLYFFATSGKISFSRKRTYWSDSVSYSKLRLLRALPPCSPGIFPGLMKMPMVTGISPLWMRLSNTVGVRKAPFSPTYPPPSWKTMTQADFFESYCFGT